MAYPVIAHDPLDWVTQVQTIQIDRDRVDDPVVDPLHVIESAGRNPAGVATDVSDPERTTVEIARA